MRHAMFCMSIAASADALTVAEARRDSHRVRAVADAHAPSAGHCRPPGASRTHALNGFLALAICIGPSGTTPVAPWRLESSNATWLPPGTHPRLNQAVHASSRRVPTRPREPPFAGCPRTRCMGSTLAPLRSRRFRSPEGRGHVLEGLVAGHRCAQMHKRSMYERPIRAVPAA
jgi:hypothetical protein